MHAFFFFFFFFLLKNVFKHFFFFCFACWLLLFLGDMCSATGGKLVFAFKLQIEGRSALIGNIYNLLLLGRMLHTCVFHFLLLLRLTVFVVLILFFQQTCAIAVEGLVTSRSLDHSFLGNQTEKRVAEIFSVSGCERRSRPGRSRETYRCFADQRSKDPVVLSLRGRGIPTEVPLTVLLREHTPLPLDEKSKKNADLIVMECFDVQRSVIFPRQILFCTLPHPSESIHQTSRWMKRLAHNAVWMDVTLLLERNRTSGGDGKGEPIAVVLPRAVQLDLAGKTLAYGTGNVGYGDAFNSPLEKLFRETHYLSDFASNEWMMLGIGGLKEQLQTLFRRVFLTRLPSLHGTVTGLDVPHVRGVMLHGPPGNGKTLVARTIAKLLDDTSKVTILNAADILSKYVGDSEKKLRDLFYEADGSTEDVAEDDFGDGANREGSGQLHVIIIDEIEAIFRSRGSISDDSSVKAFYDGLTNQLLTLMDGVETKKNILIFGLTNQLHVVDRALLRPGRFEVVIEVPLPNLDGRMEMFFIHTKKLREKGYFASDADLQVLASRTEGFSGADIAGTVRSAVSHALARYQKQLNLLFTNNADNSDEDDDSNDDYGNKNNNNRNGMHADGDLQHFQVSNEDFILALEDILESKLQTAPGEHFLRNYAYDDNVISAAQLVDYDGFFARSKSEMYNLLMSIHRSRIEHAAVVILYGPTGTGKTTLARELVNLWPFGLKEYVTHQILGNNNRDVSRLDTVLNALRAAVRFRGSSSVVIDNVEQFFRDRAFLDGDRFASIIHEFKTSAVYSSFSSFYSDNDTKGQSVAFKRLLILTTSKQEVLQELMRSVEYDLQFSLDYVHRKDIIRLLHHYGVVSSNTKLLGEIVRAYPPKLSYNHFLRITDLALWRAHDANLDASTKSSASAFSSDEKEKTKEFYSTLNSVFVNRGLGKGKEVSSFFIDTKERINEFSAAVRSVASAMGLADAFDDMFTADNTIETDEVFW